MCCCGKPTINGEPGYSWDGKSFSVRQPDPPTLADGDVLLYDGPGRCGGLDCHSHHFRLVMDRGRAALLVRHGCGDERFELGCVHRTAMAHGTWDALDENQRYWLMHTLYSTNQDAAHKARDAERSRWTKAAATKRIKTSRKGGNVKVWIEDAPVTASV